MKVYKRGSAFYCKVDELFDKMRELDLTIEYAGDSFRISDNANDNVILVDVEGETIQVLPPTFDGHKLKVFDS